MNQKTFSERFLLLAHSIEKCLNDAFSHYTSPLGEDTLEDRACNVLDELWSNLIQTLVRHDAQPPLRQRNHADTSIINYVEWCINRQRISDGHDPIYISVSTTPPTSPLTGCDCPGPVKLKELYRAAEIEVSMCAECSTFYVKTPTDDRERLATDAEEAILDIMDTFEMLRNS